MRQMILWVALLGAACAEHPPAEPRPAEPSTDVLRVGAWNLEHLGARRIQARWSPNGPRSEADFQAIAMFIRRARFDVLALSEINGPAPLKRLTRHLGADWRFVLGESGKTGRNQISVGFLWNRARVRLLQAEEMRSLPTKVPDAKEKSGMLSIFHRQPANAVFRVERDGRSLLDFRIIAVHFKASRGERNVRKRRAEVSQLRKYIQDLQRDPQQDHDILVVGDFNHSYDEPSHQTFAAGGLVRYLEQGRSPTIVHFDRPIDHIAVTKGIEAELISGSFRVLNQAVPYSNADPQLLANAKQAWRKQYSDHFPVLVELDLSSDQDPDAVFQAARHPLPVQTGPGRIKTKD